MVVLTIIVIISMVVITSQSSFNKTLILANTAYDIALALRSAESFGIGSRAVGTFVNAGYGLRFQTGNSFTLFADTNSPNAYNCHGVPSSGDINAPDAKFGDCIYGNADTVVFSYGLNNGITISKLCVNLDCSPSSLDIVFSRPNPNAFISADGYYSVNNAKACITVTSPQGGEKYVSVSKSGQIIANAVSCP